MSDHPICHIEIPATNPASTGKFYAELFDWKVESDPALNYHMFQPQRGPGGAFVEVGETTGARIGQVLIYVSANDIDVTLARAEALGAKTLTPKTEGPYGWFAVFADPAGNRIALYTAPGHSSWTVNGRLSHSQQKILKTERRPSRMASSRISGKAACSPPLRAATGRPEDEALIPIRVR